jgi:hypothetical protein
VTSLEPRTGYLVVAALLALLCATGSASLAEDDASPPAAPAQGPTDPLREAAHEMLVSPERPVADVLKSVQANDRESLLKVVGFMRQIVLGREDGFLDSLNGSSWGARKHASPSGLASPRVAALEFYIANLPRSLATAFGLPRQVDPRLGATMRRLPKAKEDVLAAIRTAGVAHWELGAVQLHDEETTRLQYGATRFLYDAGRDADGRTYAQSQDEFNGLRLSVSARADARDKWAVVVSGVYGGHSGQEHVAVRADGSVSQWGESIYAKLTGTLEASEAAAAWIGRIETSDSSTVDVLMFGRLLDIPPRRE